jgi:ribonuclease HI
MEMMAVIKGLESLEATSNLRITTDSQYVLKGITQWMPNWKRNNWKTAARKPVKNADLWKILDQLLVGHDVEWKWVKGHSGHIENERVDELANKGIDSL